MATGATTGSGTYECEVTLTVEGEAYRLFCDAVRRACDVPAPMAGPEALAYTQAHEGEVLEATQQVPGMPRYLKYVAGAWFGAVNSGAPMPAGGYLWTPAGIGVAKMHWRKLAEPTPPALPEGASWVRDADGRITHVLYRDGIATFPLNGAADLAEKSKHSEDHVHRLEGEMRLRESELAHQRHRLACLRVALEYAKAREARGLR